MLIKFFKFILIIILYQSPLYSKSKTLNKVNTRYLSDYFSGIVAYEVNDNKNALKFFFGSICLPSKHPYIETIIAKPNKI